MDEFGGTNSRYMSVDRRMISNPVKYLKNNTSSLPRSKKRYTPDMRWNFVVVP